MANLYANFAFNINDIDLNWYVRNLFSARLYDNVNIAVNGINYKDLYEAIGTTAFATLGLNFGGPQITVNANQEVTGGTVTGVLEWDYVANQALWGIEGVSVSAVKIFNSAFTASNSDEMKLVRSALSGNDTINLSSGADVMNGFDGNDTMRGNGGNDLLLGGKGNDVIRGDSGNDILRGNAGDDRIFGGLNDDLILGNGGADDLFGDSGNDVLKGGGGFDDVSGGDGRDKVIGNGGDDILLGGNGNDTLSGGAGFDVINGGPGNDVLKGLGGIDILVYEVGSGRDKIKKFQDGLDIIDLTDFNFANAGQAKSFATEIAGDTIFNFGGGDVLIVFNTSLSQFSGADFDL